MDLAAILNKFDYSLDEELIADAPLEQRDSSRLLILNRITGEINHKNFFDLIDLLTENDVLVLNESKVFPARLFGVKDTGGKVEVLLVSQKSLSNWEIIFRPGLNKNQIIYFSKNLTGKVVDKGECGRAVIRFSLKGQDFFEEINNVGVTPIPPYIKSDFNEKDLRQRYQTVYAKTVGSVAAPTAGLHFTNELLDKLKSRGVCIEYVTLHVGLGTFQNLRVENLQTNRLHNESFEIKPDVIERLNRYKNKGKRIVSVGTTSTRTLETSCQGGRLTVGGGSTQLFIQPGFKFQFVDSMITNFHLPKSSLLMLVSAFVSRPNTENDFLSFKSSVVGNAYGKAIENKYRFFSFGDAMWIV